MACYLRGVPLPVLGVGQDARGPRLVVDGLGVVEHLAVGGSVIKCRSQSEDSERAQRDIHKRYPVIAVSEYVPMEDGTE